jgi:hypothetical protein
MKKLPLCFCCKPQIQGDYSLSLWNKRMRFALIREMLIYSSLWFDTFSVRPRIKSGAGSECRAVRGVSNGQTENELCEFRAYGQILTTNGINQHRFKVQCAPAATVPVCAPLAKSGFYPIPFA